MDKLKKIPDVPSPIRQFKDWAELSVIVGGAIVSAVVGIRYFLRGQPLVLQAGFVTGCFFLWVGFVWLLWPLARRARRAIGGPEPKEPSREVLNVQAVTDLTNKVNDLTTHVNNMAAEGSVSQLSKRVDALIESQKDLPDQVRQLRDDFTPYGEQIKDLRKLLMPDHIVSDPKDVLSKLHVTYVGARTNFGDIERQMWFTFKAVNYSGADLRLTGRVRGNVFFDGIETFRLIPWSITSSDSTGRFPRNQNEIRLTVLWQLSERFAMYLASKAERNGVPVRNEGTPPPLHALFNEMAFEVEAVVGERTQSLGYKSLPQEQCEVRIVEDEHTANLRGIYDSEKNLRG
jgi:hypothetical protein